MMPLNWTGLFLTVALAAPVEPVKPDPRPAAIAEVQDLVLLHEEGPLRIRLRISNGNKSVFAAWQDHMDRWFRFADRNRNNVIDADEIDRVPSMFQMQYLLQSGQMAAQAAGIPGNVPITPADLDVDGDGRIDRHEYFSYYGTGTAGPLLVQQGFGGAAFGVNPSVVSDALFRTLDSNRDGRLTGSEISRLSEVLARFDANDDEFITAQEISGNQQYAYQQPGFGGRVGPPALNLVAVPREASELRVTARLRFAKDLLSRLDTDRNGGLDSKEFRIPAAEFAGCDGNQDGRLDAMELVKWLVGSPHLAIQVRLERLLDNDSPVEVIGDQVEVVKATADGLHFRHRDASIQLNRNSNVRNPAYNPGASMKQYFMQLINAADPEKTGSVPVEALKKNQQAAFLVSLARWLDANADGNITTQEIDDYIQLTTSGVGSQLAIGFLDQGRGLFEILDTVADGNLSLRELRDAPAVLRGYLKPGQESLARTDVPRRYHLMVAASTGGSVQMQMPGQMAVMVRPGGQPGQPQAGRRGPTWFQKMDVNADSLVSPREFLGPLTAFRKMDRDGDGLLTDAEATEFEQGQTAPPEGRRAEPLREAPTPAPG